MSFLRYALVTVPAIVLLGTLSGRASNSGYSNAWFAVLDKPAAMPPGWVFPVAWTILYIMLGLSLALVLHARGARGRPAAVALFVAQLALNYAWSPIFFGAHKVGAALVVILAMIALTIVTALLFARIRRTAALLLLPYLAWLLFAAYLNWQIGVLNPDAATLVPGQASADIPL
jgi:tryptophan-rich sensory protein